MKLGHMRGFSSSSFFSRTLMSSFPTEEKLMLVMESICMFSNQAMILY